jgi:hypothetical protein
MRIIPFSKLQFKPAYTFALLLPQPSPNQKYTRKRLLPQLSLRFLLWNPQNLADVQQISGQSV